MTDILAEAPCCSNGSTRAPGCRISPTAGRSPKSRPCSPICGGRPGFRARSGLPDLRDRVEFAFDLTRGGWPVTRPRPGTSRPLMEASEIAAGPWSRTARWDSSTVTCIQATCSGALWSPGGGHRPRCLGDHAFDAVDSVLASGDSKAAMRQRIDWLGLHVDGLDAERAWAWSQALAVVVAVSLLAHREDDPAGHALLQVASAGR